MYFRPRTAPRGAAATPLVGERRRHPTGVGRPFSVVGVLNGNYFMNQLGVVTAYAVRITDECCPFSTSASGCLRELGQ